MDLEDDDDITFLVEGPKEVTGSKGGSGVAKQHRVNSLADLLSAMRQFNKQPISNAENIAAGEFGVYLKKSNIIIRIGLIDLFATCGAEGVGLDSIKNNPDTFIDVMSYMAWDKGGPVSKSLLYPSGSQPSEIMEHPAKPPAVKPEAKPEIKNDEDTEDRFELL